MPKFMKVKEISLEKPEVMIPVKCDVHPWMSAHIGVTSHPFFGVSDGTGAFTLKGVPAGSYTVTAWHEVFGSKSVEVTVADGAATADFTYGLADLKRY